MQQIRLNPHLLSVPLYVAGKPIEQVQAEYGLSEVVKLASNENPLGPSPLALAAYQQALPFAHRYPGVGDQRLRQKLASHYSNGNGTPFNEHNFLTGNGLGDILRMIVESFIFEGGEAVFCTPTFPLYKILIQQYGGRAIVVPHKNYHYDLQAIAEAITPDTRIAFVCNPNNPTGLLLTREEVDVFLARVPPHVVVVFDESYAELVEEQNYSNVAEYVRRGRDQVLLLRGFSKVYGLANLRIGYALGTCAMIEYLHHAQIVFNTGDPVFYAAMAALDDQAYVQRVRDLIHTEKQFLYAGFAELDLAFIPTHANFILLPQLPRPAEAIYQKLLRRGVIVRVTAGFGLPEAIRVTIGTRHENEKFLRALRQVLAE